MGIINQYRIFSAGDNKANERLIMGRFQHLRMVSLRISLDRKNHAAKFSSTETEVVKQDNPYSSFNINDGDFYIGTNAYDDRYLGHPISKEPSMTSDYTTLLLKLGNLIN